MKKAYSRKIVCTNIDSCGFIEEENKETDTTEKEPQKFATVCSSCGSLALYYSKDYQPLYTKQYTQLDIENLLIKAYLQLNKLQ